MHQIHKWQNAIQLYRLPVIPSLFHQCNVISEIKSLPVTLIGTTSVWTACACCRIFSSGVGSGSDFVQLVWVLISDNSFETGVLGLLMVIGFSSSGEEMGHYKEKHRQQCKFTITKKERQGYGITKALLLQSERLLLKQTTNSQISRFDLHIVI